MRIPAGGFSYVENLDAVGMQSITAYSPTRILLLGLVRTVFGLLIGVMAAVTIWACTAGEFKPTKPGDMPVWWMYLVGAALAFGAFVLVSGGIGRMVGAFARDCYFRAGPGGLAIRLPKNGWFGRFRVVEYRLRWPEINGLVHFTHRVNLIPVSTELRIELVSGATIVVERHFFGDSIKAIQQRLMTLHAVAGR